MPQSSDAERSVLGAIVLDNGALLKVLPILRREDFFLPLHRDIYASMEGLIASGKPVDTVTLVENMGLLAKNRTVDVAYLSQLADGMPRVSNVESYAQIVKQKAGLRNLVYLANSITEEALAANEEPSEIVERAVQSMLSLEGSTNEAKIIEWSEAVSRSIEQIRAAKNDPKSVFRGRFGLKDLDEKTSGLRKKELSVVVGPTGNGKSLLAQQLAITCDADGYKGMIFSAEMSAESIALRELAYDADVFFYYLRRPETLDDDKLQKIENAASRERNIAIVDTGITPSRIFALAEARKRSAGLDLVIVDYDQLVVEAGIDPDEDEGAFFSHQSHFIHACVACAKRLDLCFVLLAQLRKAPSGMKDAKWRPTLDDLYGSSAIRNDPNTVIWILRDFFLKGMDKKYERDARAAVVKARNGNTGTVKLNFDPRLVRFGDKQKSDDPFEEEPEQPESAA